jgi:hypothetical protein
MPTAPNSNNTGKPSDQKAEFMLINLGYSCQLLFSIEEGCHFLKSYSQAKQYKKNYKEPAEIHQTPPEISISYLTASDIAKIQFDQTLGIENNDDC